MQKYFQRKLDDLTFRIFGIKSAPKKSDLIPKGTISTICPKTFIDGNKDPKWDKHLFKNITYI